MNTTHAFSWVEGWVWKRWIYNGSSVFWWAVFSMAWNKWSYKRPDNMESLQWYYEHQTLCHLMIMLWWYHAVILKGARSFKYLIIISVERTGSHTAGISCYITELHHGFHILKSVALILQVCLKSASIFSIVNHRFFVMINYYFFAVVFTTILQNAK